MKQDIYTSRYNLRSEKDEVLNHLAFKKIINKQQSFHHDVETWKRLQIIFIVISGFLCDAKSQKEGEKDGGRLVQSSFISQRVILAVNMTIDPLLSSAYQ